MKSILKYLVLGFYLFGYTQQQTANWYFSNRAGVNFDWCTDQVTNLTNLSSGSSSSQSFVYQRVPTAISDKYGNLLLYSDGNTIWDRNNQPLPNADNSIGTGLQESDEFTNFESLILPKPNDSRFYYIFTINTIAWFYTTTPQMESPGLQYSLIDMNLNNGLGDIVPSEKNISLNASNLMDIGANFFKVDSKLTAVRGDDCNSYWIITHFGATFYAYKLDENGINMTPVQSNAVPLIEMNYQNNITIYHGLGELKSSPDGTKIAHLTHSKYNEDTFLEPGSIYVYDFDKSTGLFSNTKTVFTGQNENEFPSSIEFSASSKWLYATVSDNLQLDGDESTTLLRWDVQASDIADSKETFFEVIDRYSFNSLQLGMDGRIYHSRYSFEPPQDEELATYLGVISNPDGPTVNNINYESNGLLIREDESSITRVSGNLPQQNKQWFNEGIDIVKNGISKCELFLCNGGSKFLSSIEIPGANYTWSKDNIVISGENSFELEVSVPGFYEVYIEPNDGRCPIEGWATVSPTTDFAIANDITIFQCDEDGTADGLTIYNLNNFSQEITNDSENMDVRFYRSLEDAQNENNRINDTAFSNTSNPQVIYALVTNQLSGCQNISEVTLEVTATDTIDIFYTACDEDGTIDGITSIDLNQFIPEISINLPLESQVIFYETYEDALTESYPLITPYTNSVPYNQTIYGRVENNNDCFGISEVTIEISTAPILESDETKIYCLNSFPDSIILEAGINSNNTESYTFLWSTGETSESIEVNSPGTYKVSVTNNIGCTSTRIINVESSNVANITNIEIVDISNNNSITIFVQGEGDYEFALNNSSGPYQNSNIFNQLSPGFYTGFVRDKNNCGITEQMVSVLGFPKFFTPNGDGVNDFWQISGLNSENQIAEPIRIFNRYGKILLELNPQSQGWDGTYNGKTMPSNDYWFSVIFADGREFKGNFALKH